MIKFFKKTKSFKKQNFIFNPNLYWGLAICVMFFAAFIFTLFGYYLFKKVNKEPVLKESDIRGQMETIKKERIDKVLEYFSLREQRSSQIINSPSPIIDPSL